MHSPVTLAPSSTSTSPVTNYHKLHNYPHRGGSNYQQQSDLKELTNVLSELNTNFKRNVKVLQDLKDFIVKVCEKQAARPVDDNSGIHKLEQVTVEVRLVFLKIGEIDTLKEQFQAEAFIQAKWHEPGLKGTDLDNFDPAKYWNPLLFIDNVVGDLRNDVWHKIVYDGAEIPMIYEMRKVKGVFLENLELNDFPVDVQDLTITLTTTRTVNEVQLVEDSIQLSAINTHAFIDQQEWRLHEHVETSTKLLTSPFTPSQNQHPAFSATCRAARRPGYFYWNVYFLIFFITVMAFATFSVTYNLPQNRLQLSFTLLLTAVTFKWVVVRCLPTISYLTTLDKYVLLSMVLLCVVCAWHAIIACVPSKMAPVWDVWALTTLAVLYTLFHIIFLLWMYFVTYRRRRLMKRKDKDYLRHRMQRVSSLGMPADEDGHYVSASAANTVLRMKDTLPTGRGSIPSTSSDHQQQPSILKQNHKVLTNTYALNRVSPRRVSIAYHQVNDSAQIMVPPQHLSSSSQQKPFFYHEGKQLLTSSDIEAMNLRQFRMSSLTS